MMPSFFSVAAIVLALAPGLGLARGFVQNAAFSAQMYESGAVMEQIMATKMVISIATKTTSSSKKAYSWVLFRMLGQNCAKLAFLIRPATHG
jgi:hypothetical protein